MGISDDMLAPRLPLALTMPERLQLELNDADNAARLLAVHGDALVFVDGKGWAVWDGKRYSFRSGGLAAIEIGHKLREIVLDESEAAIRMANFDPEDVLTFMEEAERKRPPMYFRDTEDAIAFLRKGVAAGLRKHATKCGNLDKIKKALESAEHRRRAEVEDLDNDPFAFVTPNGQIDLRKVAAWTPPEAAEPEEIARSKAGWLTPTDRALLPTKCGGVPFDPSADCPKWRDFLALILPDADIRACVQRILGASLFGENRAQICVLLRGPGGNGKSTLLNGLQHVLGTADGYAAPCKIEMFLETGNASSGGPTPEEINLPGARAYIATEPGARDILSAKKIKGLTGGDKRMSRGLNKDFFFWTPRGIPIISCNRTPKIKDEDEGTRRRLVFIPFDVNLRALPAEQQRAQGEVEAELRREGAGILNWLLDGFAEFMRRGVDMPEAMATLKANLMQAADPVGVFLDDMTTRDPGDRVNVTEFYNVLERWCETEGHTLYQMATVRSIMIEKGFETTKYQGRSCWRGLAWSPDAEALVREVVGDHAWTRAPATPPEPEDPPF
ncbi:hypothetical protein U879_05700 [Defluviimonas sp. 20V17]|uniref:Phage/plasmid primase, P4 family, C-terminal domain-containing protein n=1 Tax=Allgaiera indica TaxID=765699 RepID=A0AAN5A0B5_9RHOB|nr:phage/plasmid primase, P4 family [Allgaiera indica]KDB04635.1 hypothetical protein U879_05700 [Defluviimonas sp. 20V17]GHE03746.1 hypothetical protein GCM10008024_28330 [Allgaiera indica]SDX73552.1 phage/plasmid primase, P4 family, C-terminal domain-containing protein [Allgaiera indica]